MQNIFSFISSVYNAADDLSDILPGRTINKSAGLVCKIRGCGEENKIYGVFIRGQLHSAAERSWIIEVVAANQDRIIDVFFVYCP